MIQLTEKQRQTLEQGGAATASLDNRDVVLLRTDIFHRIQAVLETERALIAAGHTRGPVQIPESLTGLPLSAAERATLGDVVVLPGNRFEEIAELVLDDQERAAWHGAIGAAQRSWAQENPC